MFVVRQVASLQTEFVVTHAKEPFNSAASGFLPAESDLFANRAG
jgi:hypothetical protein